MGRNKDTPPNVSGRKDGVPSRNWRFNMASELAFALINPYTIAKSRTGGVLGRLMSRTGLELVEVLPLPS